ncbi:uncharacterized protein RHOBADRAFT_55359 [Rhodotorula graminis WP1]|uniref:Uncharacterized protein n=1 Tax=Rhodotorula graminis (strain WP1) TaxID=578459 RepID=A0A0P9GJF7_RHOGW|nr:uncharacterized protein RHOBADRAFT_55359 [Rhodotorula graminis WP1]KPV73138.1 hypothetical protein RHOBADRAFT_55359 [Rhodotorula graminis WP1]
MSLSTTPVPWEEPKQDPVFQQLKEVCAWLVARVPATYKGTIGELSTALRFHWREFVSFERLAVYERVLAAWVQLVEHGELDDDEWQALYYSKLSLEVGKTQRDQRAASHAFFCALTREKRLAELRGGVHQVAVAFYPGDPYAQQSWEHSFFANGRVTDTKIRRLAGAFHQEVIDELTKAPAKLPARRLACEASGFPPTADGLFLYAHDALSEPSSRFARFRYFVNALVVVYRAAPRHLHLAHDGRAVANLEHVRDPLARDQQAQAFAALPLELEVSAVDHARDLVFDACQRVQSGRYLLDSKRVVGLLEAAFLAHEAAVAAPADLVSTQAYPFANDAHRHEIVTAFAGDVRSQAPRSLGRERSSRFFPVARVARW